ncbi:hypothetical protein PGTUg99_014157 [Puccinia graminis f. sp. tritici]|uniref:Secreted protein n=1 Tax=Puccinia graminis f. sp. tritici TaxID=56615 RepID=A0A5B0Q0Y8_PUCGR|nr:hypothetical protein PGTUg99_014157 [Puccinia graminis f. sp. tritici]
MWSFHLFQILMVLLIQGEAPYAQANPFGCGNVKNENGRVFQTRRCVKILPGKLPARRGLPAKFYQVETSCCDNDSVPHLNNPVTIANWSTFCKNPDNTDISRDQGPPK